MLSKIRNVAILSAKVTTLQLLTLCKATKIRVFPRNAVKEKKIFIAGRKISSPCTSSVNSAEQDCFRIVLSSVALLSSAISLWLYIR